MIKLQFDIDPKPSGNRNRWKRLFFVVILATIVAATITYLLVKYVFSPMERWVVRAIFYSLVLLFWTLLWSLCAGVSKYLKDDKNALSQNVGNQPNHSELSDESE